jgi:serine/threonine protein kinase
MIGRTLSHYQIIDEISRGGMGVVYRALDLRLNREVALKVLPEDLVNDPARRHRLMQEARAASALEHPHIAVIHAVEEAEGVTFIAMELIRGDKLSDVIHRERMPARRALDLAVEVAEGLVRAHETHIVHRDLKPANVMVTDAGHAKIIDFGLAKLVAPIDGNAATAGGSLARPSLHLHDLRNRRRRRPAVLVIEEVAGETLHESLRRGHGADRRITRRCAGGVDGQDRFQLRRRNARHTDPAAA